MARLNWTTQAISDLVKIAEYIAVDSQKYAKLTVDKIRFEARQIKSAPLSGRVVPELGNNSIREKIIGNYRLIYKIVSESQVDILLVYHSSRLLNPDII